MNTYSLTSDSYLHRNGQTSKVIISSHGGILYGSKPLPDSIPFNLHFMVHGNRSTHGNVSSVASMSSSEFLTEPKGTSGVAEHELSYFPSDTQSQIRECVDDQGFDVVTIKPGGDETLKSVLKALKGLNRYSDVYCLFCRVSVGRTAKRTVSKDVLAELKQRFAKKQARRATASPVLGAMRVVVDGRPIRAFSQGAEMHEYQSRDGHGLIDQFRFAHLSAA